jgi:hypothetical protein
MRPALGFLLLPLVVSATPPAEAKSITDQLLMLAPEARLEQRCNGRLSGEVRREQPKHSPDEVVAYAFADVRTRGSELDAPGAAFRSHGRWYRAQYHCRATPDGLDIEDFSYSVGAVVPRQDWEDHYLVP